LSASADAHLKMVKQAMEGDSPENQLITEANIVEKRATIDGYVLYINENNKDFFDKATPLCDITEFMIPVEQGVQVKIFMIKPKNISNEN